MCGCRLICGFAIHLRRRLLRFGVPVDACCSANFPFIILVNQVVCCLFFYSVLLAETPYTQQQPMGDAGDCFWRLASGLGCWLVEEQTQTDQNVGSTNRREVNLKNVRAFSVYESINKTHKITLNPRKIILLSHFNKENFMGYIYRLFGLLCRFAAFLPKPSMLNACPLEYILRLLYRLGLALLGSAW